MATNSGEAATLAELLEALKLRERSLPRPVDEYEPAPYVHRVGRHRILLDGESSPPSSVQRFDGQPLYYVLDRDARDGGKVKVFTRQEDLLEYTQAASMLPYGHAELNERIGRSSQALTQDVTFYGYVDLFEHIDYVGARWRFHPNWGAIPDFTRVYPTLWWSTNINDKVSSMDVNVKADPPGTIAWVVLFDDINFGGNQLWTSDSESYDDGGGGLRRNFVNIGWNDIASSLAYGYSL
jgi:hypothetical protein